MIQSIARSGLERLVHLLTAMLRFITRFSISEAECSLFQRKIAVNTAFT